MSRTSQSRLPLALPVIALLLLSGCSQDRSDLDEFIAEVKSRKSRAIEPIPQVKQYEAFAYVPGDRRDPFVQIEPERDDTVEQAAGSGISPDFTRNREPLEGYPIDSLRMVGTISKAGIRYAVVRAPDSVLHQIRPGNHLGQNFGRVEYITETEISLVEIVPDGFGGWMERPATLALTEN